MFKARVIRIYPNKKQRILIGKTFGCCGYVYNEMLFLQKQRISNEEHANILNAYDMNHILTQLKEEKPFLKEVDSTALTATNDNLWEAYLKFFNGQSKYPRFKNKTEKKTYTSKQVNANIHIIDDHHIRLPKLKSVYFRGNIIENAKIKSVTITKKSTGKYYASILYEIEESNQFPKGGQVIGIDMGLSTLVTLSNGTKYKTIRFDKNNEDKIKNWQRCEARRRLQALEEIKNDRKLNKIDPSVYVRTLNDFSNYQKAKQRLARANAKAANQRRDYLQKLSLVIVKKYDVICVENLNVEDMLETHDRAQGITNASWGSFINMLDYKCSFYGKILIKVPAFYSSQICNVCGKNNHRLNLSKEEWVRVRRWECPYCGADHDRDINAAKVILQRGLKQL